MRMKAKIVLTVVSLVWVTAVMAQAVGVEVGVGTEPSISFAAAWEISPSLAVVTSFGAAFGGGVQTGSATVQTASYTVGVEIRYSIRLATPSVRPYLGLGALLAIGDGEVSGLVTSSAGVQVYLLRNVYLSGEAGVLVPILDLTGWFWRLKIGIGFRIPF